MRQLACQVSCSAYRLDPGIKANMNPFKFRACAVPIHSGFLFPLLCNGVAFSSLTGRALLCGEKQLCSCYFWAGASHTGMRCNSSKCLSLVQPCKLQGQPHVALAAGRNLKFVVHTGAKHNEGAHHFLAIFSRLWPQMIHQFCVCLGLPGKLCIPQIGDCLPCYNEAGSFDPLHRLWGNPAFIFIFFIIFIFFFFYSFISFLSSGA
ncbi:hypothetical protein CY34DRAFT_123133 [Suillus luteus UH-Slu-Lm8-n1]|uniref:Uncharacterized protein n=1 Tax=Suillus luteus UH-Slu-Lm8-n1 TaxID=930992 RepID=A0A0D0AHS2_9AGAM|nr:hypothetical protein CY34DRAFT_123133 [Suillus luteus UH-Slu-Lm8-n1]